MSDSDSPRKRAYRKAESYIGETFNRLTIIRIVGKNKKGRPLVECKCSCGNTHTVTLECVTNGDSKSCGCLLREQLSLPTQLRKSSQRRKRKFPQTAAKKESQARWRKSNPEKVAATAKRFREKHPEKIATEKAAHYQKVKASIVSHRKYRRHTDPIYKLEGTSRSRIRACIKGKRDVKEGSSIKYLGCTIQEARTHIESLFTDGMNWEQFMLGRIHLDHVHPVRAFDVATHEGKCAAFHYTNLQPLWMVENLRKSDFLPDGTRARSITHPATPLLGPAPLSPASNIPAPAYPL